MKRFSLLIVVCIISLSATAQRWHAGIDYIPRWVMFEEYNNLLKDANVKGSPEREFYLAYEFDDPEVSLVSLNYGYSTLSISSEMTFSYHLFRLGYGTMSRLGSKEIYFIPAVKILLAPTSYTWNWQSPPDHFGQVYRETYKASRLNFGLDISSNLMFQILGPVQGRVGASVILTPKISGPFEDKPFKGYDPGPFFQPGGGWSPLLNVTFNIGVCITI